MITVTNVFGPLNKGDWELFSQLVDILNENFPREKVCAIARDKELTQEQFEDVYVTEQLGKTVAKGRRKNISIFLMLIVCLIATKLDFAAVLLPRGQRESLRVIKNSRIVIACPGGFLEDSSFSYITHVVQLLVARLYGKPVIMAPMSIGPVRSAFGKFLLRLALKKCKKIYVRESYSKNFVEDLGIPCVLSDDLAFHLLTAKSPAVTPKKNYSWIACTVIDWNFPLSDNKKKCRENYINAISDALNALQAKCSLPIYFVLQVESDIQAIMDVAKNIEGDYTIGSSDDTPEEVIRYLSQSRFMIASRFHSYIFSMAAGCPSVAISYLPKTQYMLRMYCLDSNSIDIYNASSERILEILYTTEANLEGYLEKVKSVSKISSERRREFIGAISSALNDCEI